jgi:predicted MFS family arabinose efflux permease
VTDTIYTPVQATQTVTHWGTVICMSLLTFVLVASEFMPVSLLTPIAGELAISDGQAGQAIAVSGFFGVITSLFGNALLGKLDRRSVVLLYTAIMVVSGAIVTFAPNYLIFMVGRALLGVSVGGFWSLATAILARLVPSSDLPKALAMIHGGAAFAAVIAAPLGSFLGGVVGWRGAFFTLVPFGIIGLVWQFAVLPSLPPAREVSLAGMFGLLKNRVLTFGLVAVALSFVGQFGLTTYLRPFLEGVAGFEVNTLSLVLLVQGVAGLIGTTCIGFVLRRHLTAVVRGLPVALAALAVLLMAFSQLPVAVACLLALWGLLSGPVAVAWNTWMSRLIPSDLEAGGGLMVALMQFAITAGAFAGGTLFDTVGWQGPFALAASFLASSAILAVFATRIGTAR